MSIHKDYFKLTGEAFDVAEEFHNERKSAIKTWTDFGAKFGATDAQPYRDGQVRCFLFERGKVPNDWRKEGYSKNNCVGAVPRLNTKAGKAIEEQIKELPKVLGYIEAVRRIAPDVANASAIDAYSIGTTYATRLAFPKVTYLAAVPRTLKDDLTIPPSFKPLTWREFEQVFEDHNQAVRAMKDEEAQ